tara:strand:+ start:1704 stop:2570 length:867 start_codon:yes stop_codon:yes gene_type:complete
MNDWMKAGKIAAEAREYAKKICKEGNLYSEIANNVEDFIKGKNAGIAFPMDVSVNNMAAHYCPFLDDKSVIIKGDVVKLDIGVHVNGHVADNACTVEVGTNKWAELIKSSKDACDAGCEIAVPGYKIRKIGKVIQDTIEGNGFVSISNLSGHGVGVYEVHLPPTIPNYDNGDKTMLEEGQHIAIEPFATDGKGFVKKGKLSGVYRFIAKKPVRLDGARKLMSFIEKEYKTLPFTERWLGDFKNVKFLLKLLKRDGVIEEYEQLPEEAGGMVSQYENTVEVGVGVTTKI